MLLSVGSSSKFTEIIGRGEACQMKLSEWPRMKEIGNAQLKFFENIVIKEQLDPKIVKQQATHLGHTHKTYARYGMKPHFLDIYQQNFMNQLKDLIIENKQEKMDFVEGWTLLIAYMIERTYFAYSVH
uniref:Globin family profile domain-containing protein n=1 Tax=Panagrolaimus sp. JU765 TaxID=591449 RepID=A0AC34QF38_9BILA